jgi:hypothetical protein
LSATPVPADAAVSAASGPTDRESFEADMGGWQADTDGRARAWKLYRTTEQAVDGTTGLGYYLDGSNDAGIIWIERAFPARSNATVTVSVSFWLQSNWAGPINNWGVVGFAGVRDPETTRDMLPAIDRTGRAVGWARYTFTKQVKTDSTGTVWVAVGIWANHESTRTHHIDLVETTITST